MKNNILFLFLVLTAISCSETPVNSDEMLLDTMATMTDKMQSMNIVQYDRGASYVGDIKEATYVMKARGESQASFTKINFVLNQNMKIEKLSDEILNLLESYKIELLKKGGENIQENDERNENSIVWRKANSEYGFYPASLNLAAIKNKNNIQVVNDFFLAKNNKEPSEKGLKLWNAIQNYRIELVKNVAYNALGEKKYSFEPTDINSYSSYEDLLRKVTQMVEKSNANQLEDKAVLVDLYIQLTCQERIKYEDENVHWIASTFYNQSIVGAIAVLTQLEFDVLSAKALAHANWKSKVST